MIVSDPNRKVLTYPASLQTNLLLVECDQCGCMSKKPGRDPGEAAEKARAEGFITIPGAAIGSPKSWLCLSCSTNKG